MTTIRSIVRETVRPSYTRYTPTNGRKPEGTLYGVDGWLFTLPGETLGGRRYPQRAYAAYQVSERGMLFWQVREVGGERRQVGSHSTSRKGAVALAVGHIATQREKSAARVTKAPAAADSASRECGSAHGSTEEQGGPRQPVARLSTDERIARARAGWEAIRPHWAEIRMAYPLTGGGASLRFHDREGRPTGDLITLTSRGRAGAPNDPAGIYLLEITNGAMTDGLLIAAGWHLARKGYNYAPGAAWAPEPLREVEAKQWAEWAPLLPDGHREPAAARVPLVMTADHIAYRDALYGPPPALEERVALPEGMSARPKQHGRWEICFQNRIFFDLTWRPVIGGERWTVWTNPHATRQLTTTDNPADAVAAIVARIAERDAALTARRAKRES
ncbi:hypothetical protein ACWD0J_16950 [Streptomyces sp. NPDC003011]